ncbi:S8 family serine peptidase [Bdellovibrio sp. HCB-110]|uniref:S8 family serine peptidase n=1 Tax=Bdellovibrio sp. HCB-110 TaxID=3391182 RepID=UPI0039B5487B
MKRISRKTKILASLFGMSLITGVFFTNCAKNGFTVAGEPEKADPFLEMAWHISNTAQKVFSTDSGEAGNDLNILQTWTSGLSGKGIKILVSDDGIEDTHEDLKNNYLYTGVSKDYTKAAPYLATSSAPKATDDNHGTAVAGLAVAVANNGKGTKGVAFEASLVSANFLSSAVTQTEASLVDQAGGSFDIFSMSWGSTQNTLVSPVPSFQNQMRSGALAGRSGLGSIYVKSAGNDFRVFCKGSTSEYCIGNSNFDSDNSTPYTIIAAALNASGYAASYSSAGSNIWVSSFGGEFGDDSPAMITTDRTGCSKGFSTSSISGTLEFERGSLGNTGCNYTSTFNGTSAAAPVLSGSVALLLQANPDLSWRDVKYILAKTAVPVQYTTSGSVSHPSEGVPSGYAWEQTWVQNAAGFKFHNWYGFGRVNVDAAVAMAKSYTSPFGAFTETNWAHDRSGLNLAIPDNSATGVSDSMAVNTNINIESVQLKVWITHTNIANLALELTSPGNTKSIVINLNNALRNVSNYQGEVFLTNAFYRENSQGAWTLKVIDGKSTHTGTLTRWTLNFTGSN